VSAGSLEGDVASRKSEIVARRTNGIRRSLRWLSWVGCWALTSIIAFSGAGLGLDFISPPVHANFLDSLFTADARRYRTIADIGYFYDPRSFSIVAFFPAYPLTVRSCSKLTGITTSCSALVISNVFYMAVFILTGIYLDRRRDLSLEHLVAGDANSGPSKSEETDFTLLALGLMPFTFFFRMPYSEPMLLCCVVVALLGFVNKWPLPVVALIVGLATATRPVGVALVLPMVWYIVKTSKSLKHAVMRSIYAIPLGLWGLIGYMVFQYVKFGEPLGFAHTQENLGKANSFDKVLMLLSFEPIRDLYDPNSRGYWEDLHFSYSCIFNMQFMNGIYWVGAAVLIVVGALKQWLSAYEILLAIPLLLIPYVTLGTEVRMNSQARYAAAVFPIYIVLGKMLCRMPVGISAAILATSAFFLGAYAALFVTNQWFF
jgi:hypothetical protein